MKYDNDSKFEMINELIEYIMTNDTMVMHALAHRDKQMLIDVLKDFNPDQKEIQKIAYRLSFKDYIGEYEEEPSREIFFSVPVDWLKPILAVNEGLNENSIKNDDIPKLLERYLDEDIEQMYFNALHDGILMDKNIEYCNEFEKCFSDFVKRTQAFNSSGILSSKETKESYYDSVYRINKLMEQQSVQEESEENR